MPAHMCKYVDQMTKLPCLPSRGQTRGESEESITHRQWRSETLSVWISVMSLLSSVSHGFIHGFGKDEEFLVKMMDFFIFLHLPPKTLPSLPMFTVHTNEGGACTEHVQTY